MKLFPAKCHERATLRKLWRQTGNSSLLPAKCWPLARDRWNLSAVFKFCFCFVLLYNKSLNDWSLGEQWILFPSNLNVFLDFVSGNIEILGKQNSLFPSGPVIGVYYFTHFARATSPRQQQPLKHFPLLPKITFFQEWPVKQRLINDVYKNSFLEHHWSPFLFIFV